MPWPAVTVVVPGDYAAVADRRALEAQPWPRCGRWPRLTCWRPQASRVSSTSTSREAAGPPEKIPLKGVTSA